MSVCIVAPTSEIQWALTVTTTHNHFISHRLLNQAFLRSWIGAVLREPILQIDCAGYRWH